MNETTAQLKNFIIETLVFNYVFALHSVLSPDSGGSHDTEFCIYHYLLLYYIHFSPMHASPHNIMSSFGCSKLCINFLIFTQIVFSCNIKYRRCAYIVVFHYSSFFLGLDILS